MLWVDRLVQRLLAGRMDLLRLYQLMWLHPVLSMLWVARVYTLCLRCGFGIVLYKLFLIILEIFLEEPDIIDFSL